MIAFLPLAALAAAVLAAPVSAQAPAASGRSMIVATADLDLASARDLTRLDRRVHRAAVEVCGKAPDFDVVGRNKANRCVAQVTAAAAPQVTAKIAAAQRGQEMAANQ